MDSGERWLPVVGYEGLYEVSDQGHVQSLDRTIVTKTGIPRRVKGVPLKPATARNAVYPFVGLHVNGKQTVKTVHSLVTAAFLGPRPPGLEVLHGPGGVRDSRLANLSYGSRSDNMYDRRRDGTDWEVNKERCPRGHPLQAPNLVSCRAKNGHRECLACSRGKTKVRNYRVRHGILLDLQEEVDRYFLQLWPLESP